MNNSALFLATLVKERIPYKMKSVKGGAMFTLELETEDMLLNVHVAISDMDSRVRIVVGQLYEYDLSVQDDILDILNFAFDERRETTAIAANGQVMLRRDITAGKDFNPYYVLGAIERLKPVCDSLADKLDTLYRPLS